MNPMDHEARHELERLALSEARSGRAALAKAQALRMLERLDRDGSVEVPVDGDGRFHPGGPGWWDLDRCDPAEVSRGVAAEPLPLRCVASAFTPKQKWAICRDSRAAESACEATARVRGCTYHSLAS